MELQNHFTYRLPVPRDTSTESRDSEGVLKKNPKISTMGHRGRNGVHTQFEFYFCEKKTGTARFKVEADADGNLPADQAGSLLAMHCFVRGQTPSDYMVMKVVDGELAERVASRAARLLEAGHSIATPVRLSRREQEVLARVARNLSNKEIAAGLFISERTVKFHVSALLAKFRVRSRVGLIQEASNLLVAEQQFGGTPPVAAPAVSREARCSGLDRRGAGPQPQSAQDVARLPGRRLSA